MCPASVSQLQLAIFAGRAANPNSCNCSLVGLSVSAPRPLPEHGSWHSQTAGDLAMRGHESAGMKARAFRVKCGGARLVMRSFKFFPPRHLIALLIVCATVAVFTAGQTPQTNADESWRSTTV